MSYFFNRINSAPLEAAIPFNYKLPRRPTKLISISNITEIFNVKGTPHVHAPILYLEKKNSKLFKLYIVCTGQTVSQSG